MAVKREEIKMIGENDESCSIGEYLTSQYEVLRRILSYLSMEDLYNVSQVSLQWKAAVDVTKKERKCCESFIVSEQKYKMSLIWTEAKYIISFCTANNPKLQEQVDSFTCPNSRKLLCLSNSGVIGTTHDISQILQHKIRVGIVAPKKFYLTSLRFPNIPNVGMKVFEWKEDMTHDEFNKKFRLPGNNIVKCLIILLVEDESRQSTPQKDNFINYLKTKQKEDFAVGGCVVDDFIEDGDSLHLNNIVKYIVFYGSGVEASSTVLTSDIKTISAIENKVEKLKKRSNITGSGILFIFRCAGRQRVLRRYHPNLNDINQWESQAIIKNFPHTPVVGCLGYGEFGNEFPEDKITLKTFIDSRNMVSPPKKSRGFDLFECSFSTSLVYLSFNK